MKARRLLAHAILICAPFCASAAVLDFERVYGAVPSEGMAISNQFAGAYGIRFWRLDDSSFPIIAQMDEPGSSFGNSAAGTADMLTDPNAAAFGRFFLTDSEHILSGPKGLMLRFDAAISNVSFYVFDLDADEHITATGYGSDLDSSALVTNVYWQTNTPGAGGGLAALINIGIPTKQMRRLELKLQGRSGDPHVGFDNFSTDYIPPAPLQPTQQLRMLPSLALQGSIGRTYRIDFADRIDIQEGVTNWRTLTNIVLPASPFLYIDTRPPSSSGQRYYRTVAVP